MVMLQQLKLLENFMSPYFENDNTILVSRNNLVYFSAIPWDDIYEIDLSSSNTNDNSMYAVSNKRAKLNLDSTLLWHYHLGHISKKRIKKLQHDGLLDSTDIKSFQKCVSCMSRKMARKPYSHQVKKAKDLLGLIHTNVCGPFRTVSRQGASYSSLSLTTLVVMVIMTFPSYTPQHNSVSKRINRTLLDMVRSMISQTTLPRSFWDYAFESAARILNMVPTKNVEKTPYEVWHGQAPELSYLKVWGCEALVKRDTLTKPEKLEPRSIKCIFVGYPKEMMGYSFYYPPENKVFVARNAEFFENSRITQEASGKIDEPQSDINHIHRSIRTRRATDRLCLHVNAEEHELGDLGEPANYKAALLHPESNKWLNAMNVEMQSMRDNEVWELVDLPPNGKTVGHKWLFKKKIDMDGAVHTYKACLVAKGFTQTPGIDYVETFSHVADIRAIRILIAIVAFYDYEIWQIDVKTAFLNGYLNEEVYIEQPEDVKSYLGRCFAMKDLGEAAYSLRIKIYQDRSKQLIGLCQIAYIEKILKRYFMENSNRRTIPMQEKLKLSKSQGALTPAKKQRMQNIPNASAVGSIMYAVRCTRPDVAFAQNMTSRLQQNPSELHWTTVKNILKYLRNTKDMFIFYRGDTKRELKVSCYTDAGYLTDVDDIKSQTGYLFILNGGAVDWESTKQSIFATSSTDAEYIAAFDASKEAVWIQKFISRLGVVPTIKEPISMYYDNIGAIAIAKDHGITKGARHFRAKDYYLRETIEIGDVRIEKVDTDDNLADPFTKALAFPKHSELTNKIGMMPASSLM
ncbi:retrotransposon protein, putative, ty1-copia subclass [Tanacetum coccineum]